MSGFIPYATSALVSVLGAGLIWLAPCINPDVAGAHMAAQVFVACGLGFVVLGGLMAVALIHARMWRTSL